MPDIRLQQTNDQHFDYVQAPNGARLQANTIDTVFAAALAQFSSVLLAKFTQGEFDLLATVIVAILYYAYPLTLNGQTLGKKIFGLRVLPAEGDRPLTFSEALIRETFGKGISYLLFFAGFLMILWRDDRRGLHDLLSKTVVVQDGAVAERQKGFFAGLVKSAAVSIALTGATVAYFYYSSFIADRIEAQLTSQGLKVSDVSGNLAKGLKISGLEIINESDRITFGSIEIGFSDYEKIFSEKTLTFKAVKFTNAEMTIANGKGESLILGMLAIPFIKTEEDTDQPPSKQKFAFKKIVLKEFKAEHTKIIDPEKTLELSLLHLHDLNLELKSKNISWTQLSIRSSLADLDTNQVKFEDGNIDLSSPLTAKIYSAPGIKLVKPIDLIAALSYSNGKIQNLQINALGNKVTLTAQAEKNYQIWVNSLSPSEYLDGLPFDKISFYSSKASPTELITGLPQTASFVLGSANFVYQYRAPAESNSNSIFSSFLSSRLEAYHQAPDAQYVMKLPPGFLSGLVLGAGKIELSSSQNLQPEEILYRLGAKNAPSLAKFFVSPHPRLPANNQ